TPPLPTMKCSRRWSSDGGMDQVLATGCTALRWFLGQAAEAEGDVGAAEAEGVGERRLDRHLACLVGHAIEVAGGVGLLEVDGGRRSSPRSRGPRRRFERRGGARARAPRARARRLPRRPRTPRGDGRRDGWLARAPR